MTSKADPWWPSDGSDEWLPRIDGLLALRMLELISEDGAGNFLEVGVYKGAFSRLLLMNLPANGVGIDPYPGRPELAEALQTKLNNENLSGRFMLTDSWAQLKELSPGAAYSLIHVDGCHTEEAVAEDLSNSKDHLLPGGVIIVDDYRHFWFPGIAAAMHKFIRESRFKLCAVTSEKAYLVEEPYFALMQQNLKLAGRELAGVGVWHRWKDWDLNRAYDQPPNVNGHAPLLIVAQGTNNLSLRNRVNRLFSKSFASMKRALSQANSRP